MNSLTEEIVSRGFADYFDLEKIGISKKYDLGINEFGFREKVIQTNDGTQWDYIPEDRIYEKRRQSYIV